MNSEIKKVLLLIDGDNANNFNDGTFDAIFSAAKNYGLVAEAHVFVNKQTAKNDKLLDLATKYAIHIHLLTIKKNATDISLTIRATEKLYTDESFDTYIIVAGDHDYMPLAIEIRQRGKKAVCFYTNKTDPTQLSAFCESQKITPSAARAATSTASAATQNDKAERLETAKAVKKKIDLLLSKNEQVSLQRLGSFCTRGHVNYKAHFNTLGELLSNKEFSELFGKYKIAGQGTTTYITKK